MRTISIRQSGFGDDAWFRLEPLSTLNFSWEDPYGQKFIDAKIDSDDQTKVWELDLERTELYSAEEHLGLLFNAMEVGDTIIGRFLEGRESNSHEGLRLPAPSGIWGQPEMHREMQYNSTPVEVIIEFGVVGVSVIDHRPKEISYLYLERVFISYSTGYDGGTTSR